MGIFDAIIKGVGSQIFGEAAQGGLVEQILGLINNPQTGGLSGLIEQFNNKGLGDAVSSWVSTGENQPVSGEQMEQMLGSEKIQEIAQNLGISGADASGGLAALLPQIIDKLTPEGTVPEGGILEQGLDLLKKTLLGG
ncbi:MAG: hypothetical protein A4E65_01690 [Syntrophorhabdus sp. PtaU1.Bin153]|nr:MAG: hypothetical protein A4E65_01690 [Syntrophorhabdus sp. PtaU1.Bin153]